MSQENIPTHYLFVKKKTKSGKPSFSNKIGAGWENEWGGIVIKLTPCTTLTDRDDVYINLLPNKDLHKDPRPQPPPHGDNDVPF